MEKQAIDPLANPPPPSYANSSEPAYPTAATASYPTANYGNYTAPAQPVIIQNVPVRTLNNQNLVPFLGGLCMIHEEHRGRHWLGLVVILTIIGLAVYFRMMAPSDRSNNKLDLYSNYESTFGGY